MRPSFHRQFFELAFVLPCQRLGVLAAARLFDPFERSNPGLSSVELAAHEFTLVPCQALFTAKLLELFSEAALVRPEFVEESRAPEPFGCARARAERRAQVIALQAFALRAFFQRSRRATHAHG
jgi:hypothetical protein